MEYREIFDRHFPVWGVCPFAALAPYLLECAAKRRIPDRARSVVIALFPYALEDAQYAESDLSRYAVVPDYHIVAKKRLDDAAQELRARYPDECFEVFIDNSPLPEVAAAVQAGVGVKGKNGLLIHPVFGSWVFIGEIVTTMPLDATKRGGQTGCIGCMRCVKACPTGALSANGVDRTNCLSAITQQKQPLTPEQEALIRKTGCVWGCDICQKVCPMNKDSDTTPIDEFVRGAYPRARTTGDLSDRAYLGRGVGVIERNLKLLEDEQT